MIIPHCLTPHWLEIRITENKGRGVFTSLPIEENSLIELCPVIIVPSNEVVPDNKTVLANYVFNWGEGESAIALGYGSLYNHNTNNPNAAFQYDYEGDRILFYSLREIEAEEEILVNYSMEELGFVELG